MEHMDKNPRVYTLVARININHIKNDIPWKKYSEGKGQGEKEQVGRGREERDRIKKK